VGRFRQVETAAGQASVLFVAAGLLGLLNELVPGAAHSTALRTVYLVAFAFGLLAGRVPWGRWDARATLVLAPFAFGLIAAGRWFDPAGIETVYALWFVVVFGWVGSWHAPRTSLLLAPSATFAYIVPFMPGSPAESSKSLATVAIAIPIAVLLAEVLAAKTGAMRRAQTALEASAQLLERANLTDDLTGVGNRRRANALLDAMQSGDGLVLLDLDHFKVVNDTRGHAEGDRVLMRLGSYLLESLRDADCVARFGGEEFLILLRGAGADVGAVVERLLEGWRAVDCGVTLSAGAAVHDDQRGPTMTLKLADQLLYQAKSAGRDCVVTAPAARPSTLTA
jgi:diguanylate cyclase (GGDEF)-like protein